MKNLFLNIALMLFSTVAVSAQASMIFDFSYTSGDVNASGQLTTTALSGDAYTITGISGMINGFTISGIADAGSTAGGFSDGLVLPTDNLLFANGPLLDGGGFIISAEPMPNGLAEASVQILFAPQPNGGSSSASAISGTYLDYFGFGVTRGNFNVSPVPAAVPLPACAWLFNSALLLGLAVMRRANRQHTG